MKLAAVPRKVVYTVGYGAGWSTDDILDLIVRTDGTLVDIRLTPRSRMHQWDGGALRDLVGVRENRTPRYVHIGELGNVNYRRPEAGIVLANPAAGARRAAAYLGLGPVVLLCGCADVTKCHRHPAAHTVARVFAADVVHLDPPSELNRAGHEKCISIRQPWASMLFGLQAGRQGEFNGWHFVAGQILKKDCENRSRNLGRISGPLLIQASATITRDERGVAEHFGIPLGPLPKGAIIGRVRAIRWDPPSRRSSLWHVPGQHGLIMDRQKLFAEPIPYKGTLGLFNVPTGQLHAARHEGAGPLFAQ